ncbi:MAG: hypothetical protein BRD38_00980 [Bacteroidetes bacterium QH_9_67_14]|nr:MAG: hypothetical protein BRD38_00980 [Bacteroidetes bacterium QH_9_67_14]
MKAPGRQSHAQSSVLLVLAAAFASLLVGTVYFGFEAGVESASPAAVSATAEATPVQPVNAVIGNESYRATFGEGPKAGTSEQLRLRTHLAYVEGLLRARDVSHLTPAQRERRARLLGRLRTYRQRGVFPQNTYQRGRTPVFIDAQGRLCAVGFLIAQSAGRAAAERINERYRLDRIADMDAPAVEKWAERHGFTLRELAMIQPRYCHLDPSDPRYGGSRCEEDKDENMRKGVEVASMGLSASAALVNGYLIGTERRSRVAAGAGLVTGGASLAAGLSGEAHFAAGDYALAGASLLLSGWQLLRSDSRADAPENDGGEDDDPTIVQSERRVSTTPTVRPALVSDGTGNPTPGVYVRWSF